jgi:alkylation response protein AidB-like acyl-CoA dehydrogenase
MELTYSEKYLALQSEVRAFIAKHGHLSPKPGGGRQKPSQKALVWQKLLLEHGYFARNIPKEYGGFGLTLDVMELAVIAEEISKANVYPGIMNQGISMLVPTLLEVGTKEQCAKWIAPTISGEIIWCQGYSEPGSGSDLAAAKTRAEVVDGHFVINGQKIWTSSAHYSDMMFLLCRSEPDKPKHQGLSYLLVPMTAPGIEVRPLVTMTGRATFNETFFTDVRVPVDQIVMGRGDGWHVANVTLKFERLLLGDANRLTSRLARIRELMERTPHRAMLGLTGLGGKISAVERWRVEVRNGRRAQARIVVRDTGSGIDPELLELYEDLRPQKKGVAAVALVDGVCQGCHEKLSSVELDRVKRTEGIARCEYCRRILVL